MVSITFGELISTIKGFLNLKNPKLSVTSNDIISTPRYGKILMDSSTSASIIHESNVCINKFNTRETSANKWSTMTGSFLVSCEDKVGIKFP